MDTIPTEGDTPYTIKPSGARRRILVVDDVAAVRAFVARALSAFGYHVDGAEDGVAGWERLNAHRFDLLLTDHRMPRRTGLELVKLVRFTGMTLPIIMASGTMPVEELDRLSWLKLNATLRKPFSLHELRRTVTRVLGSAESAENISHASDSFHQRAM